MLVENVRESFPTLFYFFHAHTLHFICLHKNYSNQPHKATVYVGKWEQIVVSASSRASVLTWGGERFQCLTQTLLVRDNIKWCQFNGGPELEMHAPRNLKHESRFRSQTATYRTPQFIARILRKRKSEHGRSQGKADEDDDTSTRTFLMLATVKAINIL